jgi:predicted ArsR family transcriptional regulator
MAGLTVRAHLDKLVAEGRVDADGERFRLRG